MHPLQSLIAILILLAAANVCTSDQVMFRDVINLGGILTIRCQGSSGGPVELIVNPGSSLNMALPNHYSIGLQPRSCVGLYLMPDVYYSFTAYSYTRDHARCQRNCTLDARVDGWYGKNSTDVGWEKIAEYTIDPSYKLDPPQTPIVPAGTTKV